MPRRWPTILLVLAASCGGRTMLDAWVDAGYDGGDAGVEAASPDAGPCSTPEGVRICGGTRDCPRLTAPTCAGYGCSQTDPGGNAGVCWSDLPDKAAQLCNACSDGKVCVYRGPSELICAPPDLCQLLWEDGDTAACTYADKSAYTEAPLPSSSGPCPGGLGGESGGYLICDGACGDCGPLGLPCVGRSSGRPFGICPSLDPTGSQRTFATCSIVSGHSTACPGNAQYSCAVFVVDPANQNVAQEYGLCVPAPLCQKIAAVLPGGLDCFTP
jgi:hypothetical protein